MDTPCPGCVIMAAGDARRFGSNKLLHPYHGKPLIAHTFDAIDPALFARVCVVTQYDAVAELAAARGFLVLRNTRPDLGISHTIVLGTRALQMCPGLLYLVGDQPLLTRDSIARIVRTWQRTPHRIIGAASGEARGNPNLFPAALYPELLALTGDRGGTRVIRAHPELLQTVQLPARELCDFDTPDALPN